MKMKSLLMTTNSDSIYLSILVKFFGLLTTLYKRIDDQVKLEKISLYFRLFYSNFDNCLYLSKCDEAKS
jgi:hypothetical protein